MTTSPPDEGAASRSTTESRRAPVNGGREPRSAPKGDESKSRRRNRRGEESREKILQAASKLMSARGVTAVSLAAVESETGLPRSVALYHFGSKAGLVSAVVERGTERFLANLLPLPQNDEVRSPRQILKADFDHVYGMIDSHDEFARLILILRLTNDNPEVASTVRDLQGRWRAAIHDLITAAFSHCGHSTATAVADSLADFAVASLEGAYLTRVTAGTSVHHHLLDQTAEAIASLGAAIVAELEGDAV